VASQNSTDFYAVFMKPPVVRAGPTVRDFPAESG
jgi:hypothetical protein